LKKYVPTGMLALELTLLPGFGGSMLIDRPGENTTTRLPGYGTYAVSLKAEKNTTTKRRSSIRTIRIPPRIRTSVKFQAIRFRRI
jgi:hypothetical protein